MYVRVCKCACEAQELCRELAMEHMMRLYIPLKIGRVFFVKWKQRDSGREGETEQ